MSDENRTEAAKALEQAWSFLSQGQRQKARELADYSAQLNPQDEGPWLILAALGTPEESLEHLQKVLEINPSNQRALNGLEWARQRIKTKNEILSATKEPQDDVTPMQQSDFQFEDEFSRVEQEVISLNELENNLISKGLVTPEIGDTQPVILAGKAKLVHNEVKDAPAAQPAKKNLKEHTQPVFINDKVNSPTSSRKNTPAREPLNPTFSRKILVTIGAVFFVCIGLSAMIFMPYANLFFPSYASANSSENILKSIGEFSAISENINNTQPDETTPNNSSGQVDNSSPEPASSEPATDLLPTQTAVLTATFAPTFTNWVTTTPEVSPTPLPPSPTATPELTSTPPPTVLPIPVQSEPQVANAEFSGRWIDVDLANQMVYAYEDDEIIREFLISSGTSAHPTVKGQFHIYLKYRYDDMVGPGYNLKDVPWTMYFYKGYGLHGTYWHSNFGTPMSHGCVNMRTDDAEWLYEFAPMGTLVNVH